MRCSTNCVLSAGGKGVNVARALRNLGVPVLAVGLAGGETGKSLQEFLRGEKIPNAFVRVREPTRLNVTVPGPRLGSCDRVIQEGPRLTPKGADSIAEVYLLVPHRHALHQPQAEEKGQ